MPFQSEKQRRYLWANEPEIARDWTDTYGSRIQKDGGGIMHQFENYAHDDRDNVSVPRSFQARPQSDQVNLAYITPREEGILQSLKPGTPHRGPMEIPNYDSFDVSGGYATSGQLDAPTAGDISAGVGSGGAGAGGERTHIGPLSSGAQQAWKDTQGRRDEYKKREALNLMNAQGVWGMPAFQKTTQMYKPRSSWQKFNPLRLLGGFFGNVGRIGSGIMGLGSDWAGKMRGWNEEEGRYNTQREYEEARQKRRGQASIDRILKTKGKYESGEIDRLWKDSPLKDRLAKLQGQTGYMGADTFSGIDRDFKDPDLYADQMKEFRMKYPLDLRQSAEVPASEYEGMWDNRGITGTDASSQFANARRLMTQPTTVNVPHTGRFINPAPGATFPFTNVDPYQQNYVSPNRIRSEGIYGKGDYDDLVEQSGIGTNQRNDLVRQAAFVKDKFLQEQPFYNEKLGFKPNALTAYSLASSNPMLGDLYKKLGNKTVGQVLQELQTGKYDALPEKITNKLKEQILEKVDFGDTFQENWSSGVVEPTFKGNRLDIDEGDLNIGEMSVKPSDVLEIAEGGRISKALGGRSRDI